MSETYLIQCSSCNVTFLTEDSTDDICEPCAQNEVKILQQKIAESVLEDEEDEDEEDEDEEDEDEEDEEDEDDEEDNEDEEDE